MPKMTEQEVLDIVTSNIIPKYKMLVDVGASGFYSAASLMLTKEGYTGLLFEPHPQFYKELVEGHKDRKDVIILNKAVSNEEGELVFYCHKRYPACSSLGKNKVWYKEDTEVDEIKIKVVRLGEELTKQGVPTDFEFLKIDSEAYDYRTLKDLLENSNFRPQVIEHEIQHPGPNEFLKLMNQYGYEVISKEPHLGNMIYRRK